MKPTLINYREGFATNSSSCHSVINKPDEIAEKIKDDVINEWYYGWDDFVLKSEDEKVKYLLTTMTHNVKKIAYDKFEPENRDSEEYQKFIDDTIYKLGKYIKNKSNNFCEIWKEFNRVNGENIRTPYIDHQSIPSLIYDVFTDEIDLTSWEYIVNSLLDKNTIIYGGNDNLYEDEWINHEKLLDYNPERGDKNINVLQDLDQYIGYSYKNENDDVIAVIFEPLTGKRSVYNLTSDKPIIKHKYPMVCDVKITDNCYLGCKFCYQNSTPDGRHASLKDIKYVASVLQKNKVFEVAIGGGDPLEHPQLGEIIDIFNEHGIITNITINPHSRKLRENTEELFKMYDILYKNHAVGVSRDIYSAHALQDFFGWLHPKASCMDYIILNKHRSLKRRPDIAVHLISGIDFKTNDDFKSKIELCIEKEVSPLLLGYKKIGRGENYKGNYKFTKENPEKEIEDLFDGIDKIYDNMKFYQKRFSVDTAFVDKYQKQLDEYGADKRSYHKTEGEQSFYIDVTSRMCSISSYDNELLRGYDHEGKHSLENIIENRYEIFEL